PYFWLLVAALALVSSSSTCLRTSSLICTVFFIVRNPTERRRVMLASCARMGRAAKDNARNKVAEKRIAKCFIYPSLERVHPWRTRFLECHISTSTLDQRTESAPVAKGR